jgi:molybdopterin converting factor small subunit
MNMVEIRFFGQLTDLTKTERVLIEDMRDTDMLMNKIMEMYPALATATFKVALNNKLVNDKIEIAENSIIEFMPPFSGG